MPQINDIRELAQQNARYVSNSPQDWMSYLDVAARLYRYSFTDTLLIHAQRPDATACAELELWNQKMSRWVNRGAKGIALLDDTGPRIRLRYVFDIADTHLVRGGRTPLLWNLDSHEHEQTILDHLADTYGLSQTDSMNTALMELAQQLTADNLDEAMDGLAYEVADTFLEELDEDNIRVRFRELMTNSIFYTLSRRCGQEPMEVLDDDDFIRIVDFNKLPVLSFLGNAVSEQCEAVLFDIGREMRKIYKKEITQQLEKSVDSLYNTNTDFNALKRETKETTTKGGQENGVDVSSQGRLPVPESGREGRAADHREVRDAAQDVSEREPQELVSEYADERQAEPASGADRGSSGESGGNPAGQPEREVSGTEQGKGPAGMGGAPEQPDSDGRGNRLEGIGVQLTKTTTEQDLSEAEEEIASAFSFPDLPTVEHQIRTIEAPIQARYADEIALDPEVVDEILRTGSNRSKGQLRLIYNFMVEKTPEEYTEFVKNEYGTGGKGFEIDGSKYAGWFDDLGLRIAVGNTAKGGTIANAFLSWEDAAPLTEKDTLDGIYERFNIQRPADFTGHSLSVSDVVVLNDGSTVKAYYVDSIGFAELPEFFKERNIDLQKENLLNEELQEIEIFDKPGLFSNGRLRDEDVPDGLYRYDLRGSDYDPGQPITVEKTVVVNHAASVLMAEELDLGAEGRLELGEEGLNFTGAELTVREFMKEQQQKRNGLIHGDSDHIAVEGHIGTWYAVDETKVGGEKFFLLEHEEHGDMAACVAVNEQGKLVAEDLWNGFDEDFQEAVQKYFSEKWNMPKKEDVVSEIIEKATPVPDNSAQDYSDVPVYYEPFSYAKENDEVDLYRTSYRVNSECKQAIHEAIADNYDGMYLGDDAVDQVVRQYGMERVGYILANTLHHKSYDDRFSHSNKEWAEQVSTPEHGADRMTFRADWVVDSHPAVLDGFVTMFRKELEAQKEQEQPFVKQFYVVENLQAAPLKIGRFGNLDDAMSQYQALPSHYMKALGVEKNSDPLPGSLDILQCKNGIDTIVEDYKTVPGWDNPYIQNHVVQPLQGALAVQDVELAYELPDAYFHIQTCDDGFDYTLYNKDFTEQDGGILETDGDKPVQEAMTELLTEFGCDAAEGKVMDAAELREQADTAAEQQAEGLKEKLAAERPALEETLSFYVAECLEFTFAGEFHDHLTMEEALEAYDKIPSERMNADKCIGFCIEEDGGFVGMYELVVNDKVQRENINSINYFRDDKLVQQAISDMEKLMATRQQSKEQERGNTKKSVLDALRSLKAKKQEQPAQEQDKPKKAKKKGMEL